nr:ribonuclease H-like domain-containing protein [Tanacetum cinerariifolium]
MIKDLPPKITEEVVARERERKARTTLLMALPEDHFEKLHKMADAKEMWEAIKSKFGGNDESKKLQKYLLMQQFEGFSVSASEGLHKGYDRFQTFLSQLEIHGTGVSHDDANQKFLRSLPSLWSQEALIMRTKPGLDTLSFVNLYNNLRVFERDVKGTTASSSSNTHNVAFVSVDNTSSTNEVSTAYSVSSPSVSKSHKEGSSSYTDEINDDNMEEMDLKWQVAMISMRIKKFHKRTGRKLQFDTKDPVGFDKTKVECFNCHKIWHFARDCRAKGNQDSRRRDDGGYNGNKARDNGRRPTYQDDSKASVTIDREDIDCNSGSDNESVFINKECDLEDTHVNERYAEGMHAVPPPMTRNYMPSGPDVEIDYSKFTYGLKQTSADESDSKPVEYASSESESSIETTTSMPAPIDNAPKIVFEPKVWTDAPIIKEYESDSDDDSVSNVEENIEKPIFALSDYVKHVKFLGKMLKKQAHLITVLKLKSRVEIVTLERVLVMLPLEKHVLFVDDPHKALKDKGIIDSGCSNGRITGKGKIKAGRLDFEDVYYVEELKHSNLFSVSQMCDKKNNVLFTDTDCLVLSPDFKLPDENQGNLVRGLPSKIFENDHTCVACQKGKQHKASCKATTNKPNVAGKGHAWMFDLDYLTNSMNYELVSLENQANKSASPKEANHSAGAEANDDQCANLEEIDLYDEHFVLPICTPISTVYPSIALNDAEPSYLGDPLMLHLKDIYASQSEGVFTDSSYDDEGVVTDFNNLEITVNVSPTPTTRIHTIYPKTQILGDPVSAIQTRSKVHKNSEAHALSAFLYGTIDEEVYVTQPPRFVDPKFPNKVYKVVKALVYIKLPEL